MTTGTAGLLSQNRMDLMGCRWAADIGSEVRDLERYLGEGLSGRGAQHMQRPWAGLHLVCWRDSEETHVSGAE